MDNKREIFMLQLKTTIEWLAKLEESLSNLKKWFITVWTAVLGYSISSSFKTYQLEAILLSLSIGFSILHLVMLANKYREFAIYDLMQEYLFKRDDDALALENEILSKAIRNKKIWTIKRYRHYFFKAICTWQENIFYLLISIGSIMLPYLIK